jgi:DNA-binding XRE family transcriptional regulator
MQALTTGGCLIDRRLLARKIRSEFRTFALATFFTLMFGFWNMSNPRNVVGPQVRKLRSQQGLTQPMLAARCRRWGWDLSRETLAKIETQLRWVSDFELLCLAKALRVAVEPSAWNHQGHILTWNHQGHILMEPSGSHLNI